MRLARTSITASGVVISGPSSEPFAFSNCAYFSPPVGNLCEQVLKRLDQRVSFFSFFSFQTVAAAGLRLALVESWARERHFVSEGRR